MTRRHATYGCCGSPVGGALDRQHKCNMDRGRSADLRKDRLAGMPPANRGSGSDPSPKPRAGKAAEDALADQLARSGFIVLTWGEWLMWAMHGLALDPTVAVREARWGQALVPERRFRSDFMLPASRLFVEIEGGAHGVQRQRKSDILRAQIAEQAGYRILRVLPEQVADGSALALVRRAEGGTK